MEELYVMEKRLNDRNIYDLLEYLKENYIHNNWDSPLEVVDDPIKYIMEFKPNKEDLKDIYEMVNKRIKYYEEEQEKRINQEYEEKKRYLQDMWLRFHKIKVQIEYLLNEDNMINDNMVEVEA